MDTYREKKRKKKEKAGIHSPPHKKKMAAYIHSLPLEPCLKPGNKPSLSLPYPLFSSFADFVPPCLATSLSSQEVIFFRSLNLSKASKASELHTLEAAIGNYPHLSTSRIE